MLESRLTRSKLDSASKKNSAKCLATSLRIEFLKARMYAWSSGCAFMSASIASIMSKKASCVVLARKDWSMKAHSIGLLFIDNLCPMSAGLEFDAELAQHTGCQVGTLRLSLAATA